MLITELKVKYEKLCPLRIFKNIKLLRIIKTFDIFTYLEYYIK